MARLVVERAELVVRLAWWERVLARQGSVRVPVAAVRGVAAERDWWRALRGVSGRGGSVPGVVMVGVRGHPTGCDFVAVRARGPVVRVELHPPSPFARLAVSVRAADVDAVVRAVRRAAGL
ncbi:hypothetical protein ACIQGZ_18555 [Streptomyces sp. NPDC092296]|uniref:hypothetical protein n=1 Tax=Streptomyces sp. NPDC092296 TaxID=3366012 RepID=UPI00382AA42D